jgi:hypothetical protein
MGMEKALELLCHGSRKKLQGVLLGPQSTKVMMKGSKDVKSPVWLVGWLVGFASEKTRPIASAP